ncbi:myb-like protein X [Cajanus cajan]|uniref:myb-like protein X n=1 Tax=Cajanus cajan TaxID=3821 RepID=UPI00098DD0F1|nr:myb-like protein X [Cajanus cajan]
MESDDDFQLLPPSPVHERKLKRLKKATRAPQHSHPSALPTNFPESGNAESGPELETLGPSPRPNTPKGVTVEDDGVGAKRVLDFDSVSEEHGKVAEEAEEVGDLKTSEEVENLNTGEGERKRRSLDDLPEKKEKKKKKRVDDGDGSEKKQKESTSNKRKAEKERQETLKQLRAESQRLLRETRDAAFKPAPVVQKPISSILNKIRQRKLEILKKSSASFEDNDDFAMDEDVTNKVEKSEPVTCPAATKSDLNTPPIGDSNDAANNLSSESIPSPMAKDSESEHAFRAPIGDTQELFSDSERSDTKDEAAHEKSNNPSEVFAPSMLAMNLKLDSAPPDDDVSSDEEEEGNDKENIDPHVHGSVDLTLSPSGDPVRAFVDEEAEEEDDSDNDLQRFQDNEEGEEDDDEIEELKDMIATQYEEKSIDREKRDQLHQQWLEQQDAAGMDNLLQKLNCGSKLKEAPLIEEEEEESRETENESDDEAEEYIARSEDMKITLKKVKQMIPLMFTDKDDKYVSSDDEETKEKLARQRFYYKTEEKAEFFSLAEDESSKEVFSLIKKLNVPDTKRKGKTTSILDMPGIGQNTNISSKSSFIGRASDRFVPPSRKQGSCKIRSYIFGRDDSNSRSSILMSEDSSDTIPRESQPQKAASVKFQRNTQNKNATLNSAPQKSKVSLLEILKRSSHQAEHSIQNATVQPKESIFDAFKLVKKPTKTEARV